MTAITEITRNGSRSARGLVSIQSRLNQVVDESSSTGKQLIELYKEQNIALFDQNGQLRDSYDILKDLAAVWPNLTRNQQAEFALAQAGANQTQNFTALMDNFQVAIDATATAMDSAGSAMKENASYMESLEAQTTQLKATFQDFANNVIDKELVSSALKGLNTALEALNTPIGKTVTQWGLLTGVLTGGIVIYGQIAGKLLSAGSAVITLGKALSAGTATATMFTSAALPLAAAIGAIAVAGWKVYEWYKETHQPLSEYTSQIESNNEQLEKNQERLEEIEKLPWTEKTDEILAEKEALEKQNAELEKNIELNKELQGEAVDRTIGRTVDVYVGKQYGSANLTDARGNIKYFKTYEEALEALNEKYGETIVQEKNLADSIKATGKYAESTGSILDTNYINILEDLTDELASNNSLSDDSLELRSKNIDSIKEQVEAYQTAKDRGDDLTSSQERLIDAYNAFIETESEAKDWTEKYGDALVITDEQAQQLIKTFPILKDHLIQTNEGWVILETTVGETANALISADGRIKASSKNRVASTLADIKAEVEAYKELYTITLYQPYSNTDPDYEEKKRKIGEAKKGYEASAAALVRLQQAIARTKTEGYYDDTPKSLTSPTSTTKNKNKSTNKNKTTNKTTTKKATDLALEEFKNLQRDLEHQRELDLISEEEYYDKLEQLIKNYKAKATAHMKEYGTNVDTINRNMYQYEEEIYKGRVKLADELKEQQKKDAEEAAQAQKDALEAQKKAAEEAAKAQQKAAEEAAEAQKEALEKQKEDFETAVDYVVRQIDKEITKLQDLRDQTEEYYDDKIDAVNEANDALEDQIQYEELLNNLAKAKQQKLFVFKDGRFQYIQDIDAISSAQTELNKYEREKALQDEVKNLEELKERALASIDEQIEGWEDYKEEWKSVTTQYQEEQDKLLAEQLFGIDTEKQNWNKRLTNLSSFTDKYNSILKQITLLQGQAFEEMHLQQEQTFEEMHLQQDKYDSISEQSILSQKQTFEKMLSQQEQFFEEMLSQQEQYLSKLEQRNKDIETLLSGGKVPFTAWDGSQGNIYLDYNQDFVAKKAMEEVLGYYLEDVGDYYNPWADYDKAIETVLEEARLGGYEPRQDLLESLRQQKANQDAARAQGLISGHGSSTIIYGGIGWDSSDNEDYTNWGESGFNNHYHDDDDDDYDDRYQMHTGSSVYQDAYDKYVSEGDYESAKEVIEEAEARGQTVNKHASGTLGSAGGLSLVGEKGPELRVLNSGDGIIPADATRNLWDWAKFSPKEFNGGTMIHIANLNLPNVRDGNDFVKYMVNNFWRETVQYAST